VFTGSSVNINQVKKMVTERMERFRNNPAELLARIQQIANDRYKNFCTNGAPL
jgi:hypothetical protein